MEPEAGPSTAAYVAPSPAVTATPTPATDFYFPPTTRRQTRRTTALSRRSTGQGGRLKLKIAGDGAGGSSGGGGGGGGEAGMARYMQGYDRELDSDVEEQPMAFEEQFVLRMPPGRAETDELRDMVERRDVDPEKVWFKFKDSRRAVVNVGKTKFGAKLVDLPCIVESHKTFDGKHTFKIADICQMLLVDDQPVHDESSVSRGAFNIEDFIYPHGLTPPLRHVRKRRFRKRLNKRTIENVEKAVERLLADDAEADEVRYDVVDNARDLSDESGGEGDESGRKRGREEAFTPAGTESMGAPTPAGDSAMDEDERRDEDEEGSIDSDLVAEIEAGLLEGMGEDEREAARRPSGRADDDDDEGSSGGGSLFGSDEDDGEEDEEEEEEDEDEGQGAGDETAGGHGAQRIRLLHGEVRDLESAVARKQAELTKAASNPVIRKRVEDSLRKLQGELDSKKAALSNARSGPAPTAPEMAAGPSGSGSGSGVDDEDDGLFGGPVVGEDQAQVESMDVDVVVAED